MINRDDKELLNKIKMKLMKEDKNCPEHYAEYQAKEILELMPEELEVNLYEWLSNKPLSDIYIKELSINLLFKAWGKRGKNDFYEAVCQIRKYIDINYFTTSFAIGRFDVY